MQRTYTLEELARLLNRQPKELRKLAENDVLHGRKAQGSWTFALPDLVLWMEQEMTQVDAGKAAELENAVASARESHEETEFSELLSESLVNLFFTAKTKSSVVSEIARIAENAGMLWDADTMTSALKEREEMASTAMEGGVAILHPRRPQSDIIAQDFLVVAVSPNGVPFGGGRDNLTDVFFLLCCQSDASYLRSLGRLARIIKTDGVLDALRQAETQADVVELLSNTERELN